MASSFHSICTSSVSPRDPSFLSEGICFMRPALTLRGTWLALLLLSVVAETSAQDTLDALKARQARVQCAFEKALPATVGIRSLRGNGGGSGVVVSAEGLVMTAAHVTQATGDQVVILFSDGLEVPGKALGANRSTDAGLIQLEAEGPFPFVALGETGEVGDWCLALGHPGGFDAKRPPPIRLGQVLGLGRFLVTDCALTNGDSGGPLFDLEGKVIGIHSSIGESIANNNHVLVGAFRPDWVRMQAGETWGRLRGFVRERALLGFRISRQPGEHGFQIRQVIPGTPAAEVGMKDDDWLLAVDETALENIDQLSRALRDKSPGDRMKLRVLRGEETLEFELELISSDDLDEGRDR